MLFVSQVGLQICVFYECCWYLKRDFLCFDFGDCYFSIFLEYSFSTFKVYFGTTMFIPTYIEKHVPFSISIVGTEFIPCLSSLSFIPHLRFLFIPASEEIWCLPVILTCSEFCSNLRRCWWYLSWVLVYIFTHWFLKLPWQLLWMNAELTWESPVAMSM